MEMYFVCMYVFQGVAFEIHKFHSKIPNLITENLGVVFPPYLNEEHFIPAYLGRFVYPVHDIEDLVETAARMEFKRIVTQHMRLRLVLKDSQAINPGNCFQFPLTIVLQITSLKINKLYFYRQDHNS